jgi:hypothetical protein
LPEQRSPIANVFLFAAGVVYAAVVFAAFWAGIRAGVRLFWGR